MISSIHQSTLGQMLRCGEQFRRRYIENEIIPPGIALVRGTSVHTANEVNLKYKVKKKEDLPLSDLQDAARDKYVKIVKEKGVLLAKEEQSAKNRVLNDALNSTLRLVSLYRKKVAPEIKPVKVEDPFEINMEGVPLPLAGRMDYQEVPVVGDLKTASKSWPKGRIKSEIQPIFYSYSHEKIIGVRPRFVYHILVDTSANTTLQTQDIFPSESHYIGLKAKCLLFCRTLESGIFMPANPGAWWCSERWCGYWATCVYVGNAPAKKWV